jgi:hypothetical protein
VKWAIFVDAGRHSDRGGVFLLQKEKAPFGEKLGQIHQKGCE